MGSARHTPRGDPEVQAPEPPLSARVVWLHPQAPARPEPGQACNGCGLCCAAEPCPLGIWISHRRRGACRALSWDEGSEAYRCGALEAPARWLPLARLLPTTWSQTLVRRWIAAGQGCDCWLQVESPKA